MSLQSSQRHRRAPTVGLAACALFLFFVAHAGTAAAGGRSALTTTLRPVPAASPAAALASSTHAGYSLVLRAIPTTISASGQFVVPALSQCSPTTSGIAFWAGEATGAGQSTLGGAYIDGSMVEAQCLNGAPAYEALIEIQKTYTQLPVTVSAGDHVSVSVSTTASTPPDGAITVTFADTTKGYSDTMTGTNTSFFCPRNLPCQVTLGAAPLQNSLGQELPIPTFSTVAFSHALLDGVTPATAPSTELRQFNLVNTGNVTQIATGKLAGAGNGFHEVFKHS